MTEKMMVKAHEMEGDKVLTGASPKNKREGDAKFDGYNGSGFINVFDELPMPTKEKSNGFDESTKLDLWEDDLIKGSSEAQQIDERLRKMVELGMREIECDNFKSQRASLKV
ncbi:hypothetical protein V6N12_037216 [Hibiscus sabdariffa]|uniref:Uncharacterized protein n=1 Tax=Hibiscus sabdariffa TaxID=183260 RepID=A0ABR2C3J8_9ROSI